MADTNFGKKIEKVHFLYLAAGFSRRFGENKLLYPWRGKPLYLHLLEKLAALKADWDMVGELVVVTRYPEVAKGAKKLGALTVFPENPELGISASLQAGLRALPAGEDQGYLFAVADQPELRSETVRSLMREFLAAGGGIAAVSAGGVPGNPVIFSGAYRGELLALSGDRGGSRILKRHPENLRLLEVREEELRDLDQPEL